jgi:hypothetical protein
MIVVTIFSKSFSFSSAPTNFQIFTLMSGMPGGFGVRVAQPEKHAATQHKLRHTAVGANSYACSACAKVKAAAGCLGGALYLGLKPEPKAVAYQHIGAQAKPPGKFGSALRFIVIGVGAIDDSHTEHQARKGFQASFFRKVSRCGSHDPVYAQVNIAILVANRPHIVIMNSGLGILPLIQEFEAIFIVHFEFKADAPHAPAHNGAIKIIGTAVVGFHFIVEYIITIQVYSCFLRTGYSRNYVDKNQKRNYFSHN